MSRILFEGKRAVGVEIQHRRGAYRADPERSRRRAADQPAEQRFAVEAGHAEPVDCAFIGDEGRGTGITQQPIAADRCWSLGVRTARSVGHRGRRMSAHLQEEPQNDAVHEVGDEGDGGSLDAVVEGEQARRFQYGGAGRPGPVRGHPRMDAGQ